MNGIKEELGKTRIFVATLAVIAIFISWVMVGRASGDLVIRPFTQDGVPMRYVGPPEGEQVPGVTIAHGFSGSQQLMLAYGYALAHAGYGTILLDFDGHGANATPLDREGNALQQNLQSAYEGLIGQPEIDAAQIALLGHSMGSGAVMQAGIEQEDQYSATIAVSPTGADVTHVAPRNLLLQAGQLESPFVRNATALLEQAGGANSDFANGLARSLVIVPAVEHIAILFAPFSHELSLSWLDQTFAQQSTLTYTDFRMGYYLLQLVSWLFLAISLSPLFRFAPIMAEGVRRKPWHVIGLVVAPFLAAGGMALFNRLFSVNGVAGILVGGAFCLWLFLAGAIWLALGIRPLRPTITSIKWGLFIFAFLWIAFGLMAQFVWLPWFLIPARLMIWPFLALLCFPFLLAAGWVQQGATVVYKMGWWLGQSLFLAGGLLLTINLIPSLGFLFILLPLVPVIFGMMALIGGLVDEPWAYGLGNALFFSWLIMSLFPLV